MSRVNGVSSVCDKPHYVRLDVPDSGFTDDFDAIVQFCLERGERIHYYVFDLLYFDGFDLRESPQIERKRVLELLLKEVAVVPPIFYSDHFPTDGRELFQHACKLKLEGTISKLASAPYRSDRNENWTKINVSSGLGFPSSGLCRRRLASPRSISGRRKARISCTSAR